MIWRWRAGFLTPWRVSHHPALQSALAYIIESVGAGAITETGSKRGAQWFDVSIRDVEQLDAVFRRLPACERLCPFCRGAIAGRHLAGRNHFRVVQRRWRELGGDYAALQELIDEAWLVAWRLGLRINVVTMEQQALPATPPPPSAPPPPPVTPPAEEVDETDARCILCLCAPACIGVVHDQAGIVHRLACRACWEPRLVLDRRCPVCRDQVDAVVRVI